MPEGLEVELYRRAAVAAIGRTIAGVEVDERLATPGLPAALLGHRIVAARRIGKLLLLDTVRGRAGGPTLSLHFGMTGRLVVDGVAAIGSLEYGSARDDGAWDRLVVQFADGGVLRVNDPRRWARFGLDPDVSALGPDVFDLTAGELRAELGRRRTSVKAVLLDQRAIAGLGNLCVDEILWQAGVSPHRGADSLRPRDSNRLHAAMVEHLPAMLERGGSHTGTISPEVRAALPPCPRDGRPLARSVAGGRTTVSCPYHQR